MVFLALICLTGSWDNPVAAGNWVSLGGGFQGAPEISVTETAHDHVTLRLDLPGYGIENTMGYTRFDLPMYGWNMDAAMGQPEMPLVPVVVGLPAGMQPVAVLNEATWVPAGSGVPYPVQPMTHDCQGESYAFIELSTGLTGMHPALELGLAAQGSWAGANTVVLQFNPFRWNAQTGEFMVASSMTATVEFTGEPGHQHSVRPETSAMHRSRIVNYDQIAIPVNSSPVTIDDIVYICVVPPSNLESITPLLAMVNSIGHHVHIIEMEEGSSSYLIKTAISEVYQEGITRFALIPARHQQLESRNYGSFVGDFYYQLMDADNLPDIAVGRYAGNYTQLENQTIKTMSYITHQGESGEPSIAAKVLLCAHEEDYPGKYTANSNLVRDWDYQLADPVFETVYPPEGGTAEQVEDAINEGVNIVNYRGHGSITTWQWAPGWNAGRVYGLSNTHFPVVFNVCCNNGEHNQTYNCLSQSWMDGPGTGSSGNLGASAPSLTLVNNRFQRVLFWEIFDEGNTAAGEMFTASQTDIIQTQGGGGLSNARMYHWFGDPSMDIPNSDLPGAPFPLEANFPATLNAGPNNLHITVTSEGEPVPGAIVTVTDGIGNHPDFTETFYSQDSTDAGGQVWLAFTALEGKDLYFGVRNHNYGSITGTIDIVTEGIEGGAVHTASLGAVTPSPASTAAGISFTSPPGAHVSIRIVDLAGRTVDTIFDQSAPGGQSSVSMDASGLAPGLYFVVMNAPGATFTRKMAVVR